MTGAWEETPSSEEPDSVRRQSRRRSLRRRKVAQELDAQPSFGSADSPDHQIRIGNLVFRLIFAMMVAQVVAHRTKDRLRFTLLAGLFSLSLSYFSISGASFIRYLIEVLHYCFSDFQKICLAVPLESKQAQWAMNEKKKEENTNL